MQARHTPRKRSRHTATRVLPPVPERVCRHHMRPAAKYLARRTGGAVVFCDRSDCLPHQAKAIARLKPISDWRPSKQQKRSYERMLRLTEASSPSRSNGTARRLVSHKMVTTRKTALRRTGLVQAIRQFTREHDAALSELAELRKASVALQQAYDAALEERDALAEEVLRLTDGHAQRADDASPLPNGPAIEATRTSMLTVPA